MIPESMLDRAAPPVPARVTLPDMMPGRNHVSCWNTAAGCLLQERWTDHHGGALRLPPTSVATDLAMAVRGERVRSAAVQPPDAGH